MDKTSYENILSGGTATKIGESSPVMCLGVTFPNDKARRSHFTEELRNILRDPKFRQSEGFPIGEDEAILALSDPPYYTACPNPWLSDFINEWESQKIKQKSENKYHREPFAADVSEGKNDPIYMAHSYHTKVPYKAIMRYVLHYTEPGDIVLDGFCGSGMTGVACQLCGSKEMIQDLGYRVGLNSEILKESIDEKGATIFVPFSKTGPRKSIMADLSPAASFISYTYNMPPSSEALKELVPALKQFEADCEWMYETQHTDGRIGKINYVIWSDVFNCPECSGDINFWDVSIDKSTLQVMDSFPCSHCSKVLTKKELTRKWTTEFDEHTKTTKSVAKQVPALIHYKISNQSFTKRPDKMDFDLLSKIARLSIDEWYPTDSLPDGFNTRQPKVSHGISRVDEFFTPRALRCLARFNSKISNKINLSHLTSSLMVLSKLYRFRSQGGNLGAGGGPMNGTLYVPSLIKEIPVVKVIRQHADRADQMAVFGVPGDFLISTSSCSGYPKLGDSTIDYIFLDPPFGANINYSELNFIWESWLKVWTNNACEAIENDVQGKGPNEYRKLMTSCFSEAYRLLKPGRWMTVEFSNTNASVWNSIQTALTEAGFIVANVSALDKKQGSFKAVTTPTAVKQDLVISAYKPNGGFEDRFKKEINTEESVWDFVRTHLKYLPKFKIQAGALYPVIERDPRILFDQMVAYFVRNELMVPMSSHEFQEGLTNRFIERDGMFFLPDQAAEYDHKKLSTLQFVEAALFVSDESSAIQWLRQLLKAKPQSFQDINPQFMQQLGGWSKNELQLDLRELLNQNFLIYDGTDPVPDQIHSYLSSNWKELRNLEKRDSRLVSRALGRWYVPDPSKSGDLEKLRERALLKEFGEYKEVKKRLKIFRLEAVRAGFKKAWQERDYSTIIAVAQKIPDSVLQEDPKLLMWYDQAITRLGRE